MRTIQSWLSASLSLVFSLGLAQSSLAETLVRRSGQVKAELSYQVQDSRQSDFHLKIMRQQEVIFDQDLQIQKFDRLGSNSLQVVDLDGNKEPEVILNFFTGGAHCCTYSQIYEFHPSKKEYSYIKHNWGNFPYGLRDVDKNDIPKLQTIDDRFAYAFACFACSAFPLQIFTYRQGKLIDITRNYPELLRKDAKRLWKRYLDERQKCSATWGGCGEAPLAAYLATMYLLNQQELGWRQVKNTYIGEGCSSSDVCKGKEAFFADLKNFLHKTGYF